MAREKARAVIESLKVGEAIQISSPFAQLMPGEKVMATVIDIRPDATVFDASILGIHLGVLEYRQAENSDEKAFYMEEPK